MNTEIEELVEELMPIAKKFVTTQTCRMNAMQTQKLSVVVKELFGENLNRTCHSCIKNKLERLYTYVTSRNKLKQEIKKVKKPVKVKVFEAAKQDQDYSSMKHQELYRIAKEKGYSEKSRKKADVLAYLNSI